MVAVVVVVLLATIGRTSAFLATPLNVTDPDVVEILCPEQTTEETRDHKWITREAIRRNIRQFFLDFPPPSQPEFNIPGKATLTQIYHAYYGDHTSPARFINAVNTIAASNVNADSAAHLRYDPLIQADAEVFDEYQYGMADRYPQILTSILQDDAYSTARSLLGLSLHSLQKFYAHSTWIEQGNIDILKDLGFPSFPGFDSPAGPDEAVCTPCSSDQGECTGNVISGAGLTTGFYTYTEDAAMDYLVSKPSFGGKCSHGGVLDESSSSPAEGGINKDTASPCFSPHHYLHQQAAELAVQATDYYLSVILEAVGNDKYRQLFDLYHGSALSVVIDTTSSMGNEITAVKNQVAEIVENSAPQIYILVPFNDPNVGPVTRTEDSKEFLDAVNALSATGGGDLPEMFWGGLQLALANTPEYGNIFCFTDAVGKDGDIMDGDIAIATTQNTKVTMIFSGNDVDASEDSSNRVTTVADYHTLTDITGGLFILSDKFSIEEITPILDEGVESVDVDIIICRQNTGTRDIEVPIDDSIIDFKVQVLGTPTTCVLTNVDGTEYDIMDKDAMASTPGVDVIAYSSSIRVLRFNEPAFGIWNLHVNDDLDTYSINVMANSTLSWLGGFSVLDPAPPHPHYRAIEGRPLTDTVYYLDVNLIGYIESKVLDVDHVVYVDSFGTELRRIDYTGEVDDEFYIRSEPLPVNPFYIQLFGHVESGKVFCRLMPVMMIPVQVGVDVTATSGELGAVPGGTDSGDFLISNFGLDSNFKITGADDRGYMTSITSSVFIKYNESEIVTANFKVPFDAIPGTVSIVTVTAASETQPESVNSAITNFIVLPKEHDHDNPTCVLDEDPSCDGFTYVGICQKMNWTATATFQDGKSGMSNIYARPDGYSTEVDKYTAGTTDPVRVTYDASCCVTQADIIGVDTVGNVGKCTIDMGDLGGYILDFEAIEVGTTWVNLQWTITLTIYDVRKYALTVNDDLTHEFHCTDTTCTYNVTDLESCADQMFRLTPHFTIDASDQAGEPAYTEATTLSGDPSAPTDGQVLNVTESSAIVSWVEKENKCISLFKVCYRPFGFEAPVVCSQTVDTTFELKDLEACAIYEVKVTAINNEGKESSDSLTININTDEGSIGAPRNFVAEMTTSDTVLLYWTDPVDHGLCIETYKVTYQEHDNSVVKSLPSGNDLLNAELAPQNHTFEVKPLVPCTNYTFKVYAVSVSGFLGPFAVTDATTLEADPGPVSALKLSSITTVSMDVSWVSPEKCVDHFLLCYHNDFEVGEICHETKDTQMTLSGLLECTNYEVSVSAVTNSGFISSSNIQAARTLEVAPGKPQNLQATKEEPHSITITYDAPTEHPQCAGEYGIDIKEKTSSGRGLRKVEKESNQEHVFNSLNACTDYEIKVSAVSLGGLASESISIDTSTTEDTISAPRSLEVRTKSTTYIDLTWFEPEDNGKCVNEYYLSWNGGDMTVGPPPEGTHLPFEVEKQVTGLTPCTDYTFTLKPISVSGLEGPVTTLDDKTEC